MKRLIDRVAVVTGAASGIGRATALRLAESGCDLALADVNEAGIDETRAMARHFGRHVSVHQVDVADKARMMAFADEAVAEHGRVHIVVNNAGVSVAASFEDHSLEDFEWLMGINFWGVIYGCKFFLPHLRRVDEAHIVNVSSVLGFVGIPLNSSYCASKFAVRGFSEVLYAELRDSHIGVTSVHPGGIATDIVKSSRFTEPAGHEGVRQRTLEAFKTMMPPEKAAQAIVRGIRRRDLRVLITREAHLIDAAKRLFPSLSSQLVGSRWRDVLRRAV